MIDNIQAGVSLRPKDKRLSELLEKWRVSLELHLKYAALDEETYRRVQPWPPHERPSRWIIELALQKVQQLTGLHQSRIEMGDGAFAEALELMAFLANLVGSQHLRRFIPLADPATEVDLSITQQHPASTAAADQTREMPRPAPPPAHAAQNRASTRPARSTRKANSARSSARAQTRKPDPDAANRSTEQVLADAKRFMEWGRKWHELPELISRLAGRPAVAEVRRILREHESVIR